MEVEAYLMRHPAINLAAVVSYPDPRLSEVGVAFVRCEPGQLVSESDVLAYCRGGIAGGEGRVSFARGEAGQLVSESDVLAYCRGRIAGFKIPRHVFLVDEFPMTSSGKIQKVKLREEALRRLAGHAGSQ